MLEQPQPSAYTFKNRRNDPFRKPGGQIARCGVDGAIRIVFDLVQDALNEGCGYAAACGRLQEMPRHDLVDDVMAVVADSHRQLHAVMPDFSGIHIRRRHDVVERRQAEPAAG